MSKQLYIDPSAVRAPGSIHFEDIPVNQYQKTVRDEVGNFTKAQLVNIYRDMLTLREFETMINRIKTTGEYEGVAYNHPGPAHLSMGQESAAVGEAFHLDVNDFIFGSHRAHCDILAKGLSAIEKLSDDELLDIMKNFLGGKTLSVVEKGEHATVKDLAIDFLLYGAMSEIFARETGFNRGLGGSMHTFFTPFGIYPNNAIVGGSGTIAMGAALYKRVNRKGGIVVANIGDGALGRGPVLEALNMSGMGQLNTLWEDDMQRRPAGAVQHLQQPVRHGRPDQRRDHGLRHPRAPGRRLQPQPDARRARRRLQPAGRHRGLWPQEEDPPREQGPGAPRRRHLPLLRSQPVGQFLLPHQGRDRRLGGAGSDHRVPQAARSRPAWRPRRTATTSSRRVDDAIFRNFKLAIDEEISPRMDLTKNPDEIADMMFTNGHVEAFSDAKPDVNMPMEENPRVQAIARKERWGFDANGKPVSKNKVYQLRDGLFEAIIDRFYKDASLITYGEDVRDWGGAFAVYRGLTEALPYHRLFNSPISESAIVGSAVGYAMAGGRALVELMYCDFLACAGDEVFNQMAKWQAMSADIIKMPVVLRVSVGSKYGAQHSQDWSALAAHIPGLKLAFPATPYDAKGLMASALVGTDPVVFFESQRIYDVGEQFHEGGVPKDYYEIPFGKADVKREGKDITILTFGAVLYRAIKAADELKEKYGMEAEIIDARTLVPFDYDTVIESVKKTGRIVIVTDACERGSFASEVARQITEMAFDESGCPAGRGGFQELDHPGARAGRGLLPAAVLDPRRHRRQDRSAQGSRAHDQPDARREAAQRAPRRVSGAAERR